MLGVFGRYGVFAAANWGLGSTETSELAGFKAFINYDRKGSAFGNLELTVKGETPSVNSVYAARDSKNSKRLTLVIINKSIDSSPFKIELTGFPVLSSKGYAITVGNYLTPLTAEITNIADGIEYTAPPLSVTTVQVMER